MSEKRYLSCAESAKLIRKALKKAFPGVKFYVTSSTYSMGASISIDWIDGPTTKEVDSVVKVYEGADFDGMIDLKCYWYHWLMPDGSVQVAKGGGTENSRGYIRAIENPKPHPDAELVSMGADYIHTNRSYSRAFLEQVAQDFHNKTKWDIPEIKDNTWWGGSKSRPGAAYFVDSYDHKAPNSDEPLGRLYSREAWDTSNFEKPESKPEPEKPSNGKEPRIEVDRDWVWVYFSDKPGEHTLESLRSLKDLFGGGFSGKRQGWYFKSLKAKPHVEEIASETWRF